MFRFVVAPLPINIDRQIYATSRWVLAILAWASGWVCTVAIADESESGGVTAGGVTAGGVAATGVTAIEFTAADYADPQTRRLHAPPWSSVETIRSDDATLLRVNVPKRGEVNWSVVMHSPANTAPIRKGDLLVYQVTLRAVDDGNGGSIDAGDVAVFAESIEARKGGSVGGHVAPTSKWQTFRRSIPAPFDFQPGTFRMALHLACRAQTIDFSDAKLEVFPGDTDATAMNLDRITWDGREPDAAWRSEAEARIDRLRRRDATIKVVDADGRPVADAEVNLKLLRHQFRFGTFVGGSMLGDSETAVRLRNEVKRRFNYITLPAYLADWGWRNDSNRRSYFELADWAANNNIPARGHLLVYPGWTATPSEWFSIPKDQLREKLAAHIPRAIRAFKPRGVTEWDVTNELRMNEQFMREIATRDDGGISVAADWFKTARRHLPDGDLYLNETFILNNRGNTESNQQTLLTHYRALIDAGATIDGIGMQGHFGAEFTPPTRLLEIFDRFAETGCKILITEMDMDNDDKDAQADYLRDFYTACFSHPAVVGVIRWGFWEGDMWKPRSASLDRSFNENALGKMHRSMVHDHWSNDIAKTTDQTGTISTRVFAGEQRLTVRVGDYEYSREFTAEAASYGDEPIIQTVVVP